MAFMSQERKAELAPAIKAVLNKYNVKASIAVRHHSTLVVNIKSGAIDFLKMFNHDPDRFQGYISVNVYWIDDSWSGVAKEFLLAIKSAMMNGNHDRSDSMTDYFDVGWYIDINIGQYDKPYVVI